MHAGELEASVLLATYPTYVSDGWNTTDHSAHDRRYLTTLGTSACTSTGVIGQPSQATREKGLGARTTSAPQPEHSSACSHRHTTEHVRRGGSRPLALPSATTDPSALPLRVSLSKSSERRCENFLYCYQGNESAPPIRGPGGPQVGQ
jgi:hypothetical protein